MARYFDGAAASGGYITATFPRAPQKTFTAWIFKEGSGGNAQGRIFNSGATAGELFYTDPTQVLYESPHQTVRGQWFFTSNPLNVWAHVAVVYDGSNTANDAVMYLNGVSQSVTRNAAPSGTLDSAVSTVAFGNRSSGDATFQGRLAEIAFFSRLLSAAEIMQIYRNGLEGFVPRFYMPLSKYRGSLELDVSGYANHGRIIDTSTSPVLNGLDPPTVQRNAYRPDRPRPEWFIPTAAPTATSLPIFVQC